MMTFVNGGALLALASLVAEVSARGQARREIARRGRPVVVAAVAARAHLGRYQLETDQFRRVTAVDA